MDGLLWEIGVIEDLVFGNGSGESSILQSNVAIQHLNMCITLFR